MTLCGRLGEKHQVSDYLHASTAVLLSVGVPDVVKLTIRCSGCNEADIEQHKKEAAFFKHVTAWLGIFSFLFLFFFQSRLRIWKSLR